MTDTRPYLWAHLLQGEDTGSGAVKVVCAPTYDALVAQHLKVRDKLLELAGECAECGGTGTILAHGRQQAVCEIAQVQQCPDCADIREALS